MIVYISFYKNRMRQVTFSNYLSCFTTAPSFWRCSVNNKHFLVLNTIDIYDNVFAKLVIFKYAQSIVVNIRSHSNLSQFWDILHFFCSNPGQQAAHWVPQVLCWQRQTKMLVSLSGSAGSHVSAWPLHMHRPPILMSLIL